MIISKMANSLRKVSKLYILCLLLAALIPKYTSAQLWTQLPTSGNPTGRANASSIYISSGNRMIMYGGRNAAGTLNDVWSLNLNTNVWQDITPTSGLLPAPRFSQNAVYDSLMNRMIIWSGQGTELYNDVWAFNLSSNSWQQLSPDGNVTGVPLKRYGTAAVFDPVNRRLVNFAGFTTSGRFEDTWSFNVDSMIWTDRTNAFHPELRCLHSGTITPDKTRMIIYGGQHGGALSDIWSLNLNTFVWTNITPTLKPTGRFFSQVICTNSNKAVIFGGQSNTTFLSDLWKYSIDSSKWDSVAQRGIKPTARWGHTAVYSPSGDKLIIFGGNDGNYPNETWQFSSISTVGINTTSSSVPEKFRLQQNYPNPFNPNTKINFEIPVSGIVTLKVYDITGKQISELINERITAGSYSVNFDGKNIASGVYFYTLSVGDIKETRKMLLVK